MRRFILSSFIALVPTIAGCDAEAPTEAEALVQPREAATPQTRRTIESMLRAHHENDLPSRSAIEAHAGGVDALRWLAEHHDLRLVRARALMALAHFPEPASASVVQRVLEDAETPAGVRAAATRALAGWDLSQREDLRGLALEGLEDDDPRISVAAATVLLDVPEAQAQLETRRRTANTSVLERALAPSSAM